MNPGLFGWIETLVVVLLGGLPRTQETAVGLCPRRIHHDSTDEPRDGSSSALCLVSKLDALGMGFPSRQQRNLFFVNWVLTSGGD